jgi:oxygen-dependent protoporphyrinogen oxidase
MASAFPTVAAAVARHGSLAAALWKHRAPAAPLPRGSYTLRGGLGTIGAAAEARFAGRVRRVRVEEIAGTRSGWRLLGRDDSGAGLAEVVDVAVVAAPAGVAAGLVRRHAPAASDALEGLAYSPILSLHWLSADAAFPAGFGYLAGPAERAGVLGTLFTSSLFPDRVPPGRSAGVTMIGGLADPGAVEIDALAAGERLLAEHRALIGREMTLERTELVRHRRAVPVPAPGHADRRRAAHRALPAGLALAGAWDGAGAMEDAVASGEAAVERALLAHGGLVRAA